MTKKAPIAALMLAALMAAAGPTSIARAQANAPVAAAPAPAAAPAEKTPIFIDPAKFPPGLILPPPPAPESAETKSELAELHRIQSERSQADLDAAIADDAQEDIFIFASVFGPGFNATALPKTAALGKKIRNDMGIVENAAKKFFARPRPWYVDAAIKGCPVKPGKDPMSSYPSGHASSGYVLGVVLAAAAPDKAAAILARAHAYGEHRLTCGVHYRSDVQASQALATLVAYEMLENDAFRAELKGVADELRAAGLTAR